MELARLASKQQQVSSKLAPRGPFWASEQLGSQNRKNVTTLSRMVFRNFLRNTFFFRSGPQVVAKGDLLGFWPALGRGHFEKFRARVKNRKTQFPGARGTFGEKICPPQKFTPDILQLFYILRFGRTDPQGREIAKYGVPRPFGRGQPLALREILGAKQKNTNSLIEKREKREPKPLQLGPNTQPRLG